MHRRYIRIDGSSSIRPARLLGLTAILWASTLAWVPRLPARQSRSVLRAAQVGAARPAQAALALRGVTVVDVSDGRLLPAQTVVIVGNRIAQVGPTSTARVPPDARIVDARGKYLMPGLWDMHSHIGMILPPSEQAPVMRALHTLLLANGVTGIRDAGTSVPLDSLILWRRAILAGRRVGPPRQLLAGLHLQEGEVGDMTHQLSVFSLEDVREAVDSLLAAGADHVKVHSFEPPLHDSTTAELRRRGVLFGDHDMRLDSGARFGDHGFVADGGGDGLVMGGCEGDSVSLERCRRTAEQLRQKDLWVVKNPLGGRGLGLYSALRRLSPEQQQRTEVPAALPLSPREETQGRWAMLQRAEVPLLVGTDFPLQRMREWEVGYMVHDAVAQAVWYGLTPLQALQALQAATLNPAKALHATDSLGTVAPGKLADLVLLDANPLQIIQNTLTIRAVIANGRYYDRAALDRLLAGIDYDRLIPPYREAAVGWRPPPIPWADLLGNWKGHRYSEAVDSVGRMVHAIDPEEYTLTLRPDSTWERLPTGAGSDGTNSSRRESGWWGVTGDSLWFNKPQPTQMPSHAVFKRGKLLICAYSEPRCGRPDWSFTRAK